jgi:aspartyl-tRNA(Asn)/glutamyl-tRNA(Gln) amidotransferase subunit C
MYYFATGLEAGFQRRFQPARRYPDGRRMAPRTRPVNQESALKIDRDTIDQLAVLARLRFDASEAADIAPKLTRIVEFVNQLEAADTADVVPMAHPLDQVQRLRPDEADPGIDRERLQRSAAAVADGLYLVPRVIE